MKKMTCDTRLLEELAHGYFAAKHDARERLLATMDAIYDVLVTIDYPDAVTGSLRRLTDGVRGISERTRGDLTTSAGQQRLARALAEARTQAQTSVFNASTDPSSAFKAPIDPSSP